MVPFAGATINGAQPALVVLLVVRKVVHEVVQEHEETRCSIT